MLSTVPASPVSASAIWPSPAESVSPPAELRRVFYLAAHGGYSGQSVPLGGGAAVCEMLLDEWRRTRPFDVQLVSPAILGPGAPSARDLVAFGERAYARFCREFSAAATAEVLRNDPAGAAVLVNDVSEGPDFPRLAAAGFPIVTIYHVDVVAYVAAIYGRSLLAPETLARWYRRLRNSPAARILPSMAALVFEQQENSLRYSRAAVVPSEALRGLMLRCYPSLPHSLFLVLPWGVAGAAPPPSETAAAARLLRAEFGVPDDARVLLTLSRISPEKGQDLLLEALIESERRSDHTAQPLWLFICGEAAYMQGRRFLARLQALAARLRRTRVVFPGYVCGLRKHAFFALADLYVFPSRHESYGLTLLEALRAGCPALCLDHHGARAVMRPEFGRLVPIGSRRETIRGLREALVSLLASPDERRRMGEAARAWAQGQSFSAAADALARLLNLYGAGS